MIYFTRIMHLKGFSEHFFVIHSTYVALTHHHLLRILDHEFLLWPRLYLCRHLHVHFARAGQDQATTIDYPVRTADTRLFRIHMFYVVFVLKLCENSGVSIVVFNA